MGVIRRSPVLSATRLLHRACPVEMPVLLVLMVLNVAAGTAATVVGGLVVGAVPAAIEHGLSSPQGGHLKAMIALSAGLAVVSMVLGVLSSLVGVALNARWSLHLQRTAMRTTLGPTGIAHLEDPGFADEFNLALQTPGSSPYEFPQGLFPVLGTRLRGVSSAIVLAGFAWWAPLFLIAAMVAQSRYANRELDLLFHFYGTATPETRRSEYFRQLAVMPTAAKEMRAFGLGAWAVDRFSRTWLASMGDIWRKRRALRRRMMGQVAIEFVAFGVVYVAIARAGTSGAISLGALAVFVQAAAGVRGFGMVGDQQYVLRNSANSIPHLLGLPDHEAMDRARLAGRATPAPDSPTEAVRFEAVRFTYPGTTTPVFDGLDLDLPAGSSTAIVGANGAGKTTLVKLLGRLYDPDEGRITVDGTDLRQLDPKAWRERLAVIFQDFVQYPLTAAENVDLRGAGLDPDELDRVARLAGADGVVAELEEGWATVLSRQFAGGTDLSGGQWQKVALARALAAAGGGGVLVLDEPTANLDVRSEVELFDRFLDLTAGLTTVLISHRFSTVRRADRICVIEEGRLVEEGTHDELLAADGRYATMFRLQAERFTEDDLTAAEPR